MTCPKIHPEAHTHLEQLSRFWVFNRKILATTLAEQIATLNELASALFDAHTALQQQAATLGRDKDALSQGLALRSEQARTLGEELKHWQEQYAELKQRKDKELAASQQALQALQAQSILLAQANLSIADLQQQTITLEHDKTALSQELALCGEQARKIGDELAASQQTQQTQSYFIEQLEQTNANLRDDYQEKNRTHLTYQERFSLVRNMLALPQPHNTGLDSLSALINQEFRSFAADFSSLEDEAGALIDLQNVYEELKRTVEFPAIKDKYLLAIAGGFSSGKSAFINSFIQANSLKLATGINPVTVIPSYVVCAPKIEIRAYNAQGSSLELEVKMYEDISHEYIEAIGFDLRRIMPSISVKVPMDRELFEHICLTDTPGYNAGNGASAESMDKATAISSVKQCSAMIWVIGLDPAGTITKSDIKFIQEVNKHGKSLYIVLNKADLKSEKDIEGIMLQIVEKLERYDVEYAGICAYSSMTKKTYAHYGDTLHKFIHAHNRVSDIYFHFKSKIDEVFSRFEQATKDDINQSKQFEKILNDIRLSTLKYSGTEGYNEIKAVVNAASNASAEFFNTPKLEKKSLKLNN